MKATPSKVLWYTSLATGAGLGSIAEGSIIYTGANLTGPVITIDLDNNAASDFRLEVAINNGQEKSNLVPLNPNSGISLTLNGNADKLALGETIGVASPFSNPSETKTLFDEAAPANFDWSVGSRGYLGLRIDVSGNTVYGWADVSINPVAGNSFNHTLYGYAFETTPGANIAAGAVPEPTTAMLLVAGAAGAASIRRRRV